MFPCVPRGKVPLTQHGHKDGTTDESQIITWWTQFPDANIGYTLPADCIVVDSDPRNGSTSFWDASPHVRTVGTEVWLTVSSGGGGTHHYFRRPNELHSIRKSIAAGIDIKSEGGYVLLPPSVTEGVYEWVNNGVTEPTELPQWLYEMIKKPELTPKQVVLGISDPNDHRPGTLYNRTATIEEILEPHGWTLVDVDGEESRWKRPGSTSASSATFNYNGSNLLYVFSSSAEPFEADTAYSLFAAYTLLNHGGDYKEAARQISMEQINSITVEEPTPEAYSFKPAFPQGHFVTDYIKYAELQTDAPREYHEAGALSLIALVTPSTRGSLAPYPSGLPTNLYSVLVGGTTRSRKSTAQRICQSLAKEVSPFSVLPNRATTEALIEAMSDHSGFATLWTPDEFGVQLAEIYRRDFLNGLEEMLLTLYAGDNYSYQRTKKGQFDSGKVEVYNPHLNVLGAATPESLMRAGSTALESGLLPRFAVVYPKVLPEPRPAAPADSNLDSLRQALVSRLRAVSTYGKGITRVTYSRASLASLNASESILVGYGNHTARLPTMLYKVSMLSALADLRSEVNEQDAESAIAVVNRWAEGVNNLRPMLSMRSVDVDFERSVQTAKEVFNRIKQNGVVSRALVARELRLSEDAFARIERTLMGRAEVRIEGGTWISS